MSDSPSASITDIRIEILDEIKASFKREVIDLVRSRNKWRKIESFFEVMAQVSLFTTTVLAFTGGIYDDKILVYLTGLFSTLSMALIKAASYATNECLERHNILNSYLARVRIKDIPVNITSEV